MIRTYIQERKAATSMIDQLARRIVLKMLDRIRRGRITIDEDGDLHRLGSGEGPTVNLRVHSPVFYRMVLFGGSIGAGESYIKRLWETDDLTGLVRIMVRNMDMLDRMDEGLFSLLLRPVRLVEHALKKNNKKGSKQNILSHYDLGNTMYASFLDSTMMYSSAVFPEKSSTLEEAARYKLDMICQKLNLEPQDHVLEIGSGWGGFALHAAKHYGCRVTTTTISDAQYREAAKRIKEAGLGGRITLLRKDYRELSGKFDKLVSIEMIEAVGSRYLPLFFKQCEQLLKPDGQMLLQAITIADQKYDQYLRSVDFIQHLIFPGGCLLSNTKMLHLIADKTDMVVRSIEDFGLHYARTLQEWRARFQASFLTLKKQGFDEQFRRLWEFYLCYCEGGFLERSISVVQLVATRPQFRGKGPQL
jgi:cyclopropane-fatty-acyl-phospholipid synthase